MSTSETSELTTLPTAPPMMTPTASASAFDSVKKPLNSLSMALPPREGDAC
jgi:hypothetical protein